MTLKASIGCRYFLDMPEQMCAMVPKPGDTLTWKITIPSRDEDNDETVGVEHNASPYVAVAFESSDGQSGSTPFQGDFTVPAGGELVLTLTGTVQEVPKKCGQTYTPVVRVKYPDCYECDPVAPVVYLTQATPRFDPSLGDSQTHMLDALFDDPFIYSTVVDVINDGGNFVEALKILLAAPPAEL